MAEDGQGNVLRREPSRHRAYGLLLSRLRRGRRRQAAAQGMRAPLARTPIRGFARFSADAARGIVCTELASGRARQIEHDRNRCRLARVHTALLAIAASVVAQQWLDQAQSVVRARAHSLSAQARESRIVVTGRHRLFLAVMLTLGLISCAPEVAPKGL